MSRTTGLASIAVIGIAAYFVQNQVALPAKSTVAPKASWSDEAVDTAQLQGQSTEVAALRQQLAALREEVAAMRNERHQEPARMDTKPQGPVPTKRDVEAAAEAWHAHMADVEADFFKEVRDPQWASTMASVLRDAASKTEVVGSGLQKLECRSQTCRVEIKDDGSGRLVEQVRMFLQQMGQDLPTMQSERVDDGYGQKTLILYLAKGNTGPKSQTKSG